MGHCTVCQVELALLPHWCEEIFVYSVSLWSLSHWVHSVLINDHISWLVIMTLTYRMSCCLHLFLLNTNTASSHLFTFTSQQKVANERSLDIWKTYLIYITPPWPHLKWRTPSFSNSCTDYHSSCISDRSHDEADPLFQLQPESIPPSCSCLTFFLFSPAGAQKTERCIAKSPVLRRCSCSVSHHCLHRLLLSNLW